MYASQIDSALAKPALYAELAQTLEALLAGETDEIARLANAAALLFDALPDVNWAGFYLLREGELVVGPFQGKPACIRIPMGRGVCGTAAERRATVVVEDVHAFADHIACDAASNSEIVVPMVRDGALYGVLDVDSPSPGRFDEEDGRGLERFVAVLLEATSG